MPFEKIRWPRSLRTRLLGVFFAGMVLSAGFVAISVWALAGPFDERMLHRGIEGYTQDIAGHVRFDARGQAMGVDESRVEAWVFTGMGSEAALRILDEAGRVVYAPEGQAQPQALAPDGLPFEARRHSFALIRNGVEMHAATVPLLHEGRSWYVQFALSDRLVRQVRQSVGVRGLWKGMAATCLCFFVIFLATTHFTVRRALKPLNAASAAAQRITPRTLGERLDADAQPVEIRPLVTAFNQVLERLQHGFRTQQEFLASAAHELKTPLALMRAQLELGLNTDRDQQLLLQDVDRMGRQVQQLLILAEVSEPQNYSIEAHDPRSTIEEVFDFMARVAERHGVYLSLRLDLDLRQWMVDRGALFTLLKNLLENAIQHSPAGEVVALVASSKGFTVTDRGPGQAPEQLSRIFERFWRGPERREEGAGLGLSICKEIALAHGWQLSAVPAAPGLEMRVLMKA
jgi:signal transduction histidine kinase